MHFALTAPEGRKSAKNCMKFAKFALGMRTNPLKFPLINAALLIRRSAALWDKSKSKGAINKGTTQGF